jgi:hypothetical protein
MSPTVGSAIFNPLDKLFGTIIASLVILRLIRKKKENRHELDATATTTTIPPNPSENGDGPLDDDVDGPWGEDGYELADMPAEKH